MPPLSVLEDRSLPTSLRLSPAALLGITREFARDAPTWRALAQHQPHERWFRRIVAHDTFDSWLIGSDSHQGVDLHDHGGESGALYVVDGELLETSGRTTAPRVGELREQLLTVGTARAFGPTMCIASSIRRPPWRPASTFTLRRC